MTRSVYIAFERFEFYRLQETRSSMMQHKYVNKEEIAKEQANVDSNVEWKWVFHLKPEKIKKYGRFWKPASQNSEKTSAKSK